MLRLMGGSVIFCFLGFVSFAFAESPGPVQTAVAVDKQLAAEVPTGSTAAKWAKDDIYLRRVTLDIIGRNPTMEEITAFSLDPAPTKRIKVVEALLENDKYGENWARYWRDVIMYRRSEDRALIASGALHTYLVEELNKNTSWDKLASSFITAEGDVTENGATALMMAQDGRPEETTAEVAQISFGIQIQCAQCHDHPTDSWKREQFHQLTAFFPRVAVRPVRMEEKRSFEVVGNDAARGRGRPGNANRYIGSPEHYMPDLENPTAQGDLMTPVLFTTGQKLKLGTKDWERRAQLAKWLTAPDNEWFAKAIVNRLWSELVGEGFYEPVDDMGPERECSAPKTLDLLSKGFVASGHDIKWLFNTIMATEAYQRNSASRRNPDQQPFAANVAQRLRGDQIYSNLVNALGIADGGGGAGGRYGLRGGPRNQFNNTFGYDPSSPRDEVAGSIPQALAMMNSPLINGAISGGGNAIGGGGFGRPGAGMAQRGAARGGRSELSRTIAKIKDDRELIGELYLKTLAREPSESEITTALAYIKDVDSRTEAFEDLQWALVNSTEFLHRR